MRRIIFLAAITVGFFHTSQAQQDAQFSYFMNNFLYYNPAYAGVENVTKMTLIHRDQWSFYESSFDNGLAPRTQVLSMSSPIFRVRGAAGFGAHIVHDQLGASNNLEAQGSFAYHLGINESKISIGARLGFFSQTLDFDIYRKIHADDPQIPSGGTESQIRPDLAAGIFFLHEKYYAGVSFNHLLRSTFDFGFDGSRNALETHMYLTGGFYYNLSTVAKFHFPLMFQTDLNNYSFSGGMIMTMMERNQEKMWGGLMLRQSEDIGLMLGYHFLKDKSLKVGYSFGYVYRDQAAKSRTSNEFILMYELPAMGPVDKKQQHTPRFRH